MQNTDFLKARFGIEIEMTGVTRNKAAKVVAEVLRGSIKRENDYYDTYKVTAADGRVWKLMYDGSIYTQKKVNDEKVAATKEYSVELVSPILTYKEDIPVELETGEIVTAMVYIMTNKIKDRIHLNSPSQSYLRTVKEGYRSAGFDLGFIDEAIEISTKREK